MADRFPERNCRIFIEVANGKSLQSVSERYDISTERVRQIFSKFTRRLINPVLENNHLDGLKSDLISVRGNSDAWVCGMNKYIGYNGLDLNN